VGSVEEVVIKKKNGLRKSRTKSIGHRSGRMERERGARVSATSEDAASSVQESQRGTRKGDREKCKYAEGGKKEKEKKIEKKLSIALLHRVPSMGKPYEGVKDCRSKVQRRRISKNTENGEGRKRLPIET